MSEDKKDIKVAPPSEFTTSDNEKKGVSTEESYKPTDEAKKKAEELLSKRAEYLDAVKKIDDLVAQLMYGVGQYSEGKYSCNGFGIGYDLSDYTCRELCKKELQSACKVLASTGKMKQNLNQNIFGVIHKEDKQ